MGFTFKNTRSNSSQAAGGRSFRKRSVTSLANEQPAKRSKTEGSDSKKLNNQMKRLMAKDPKKLSFNEATLLSELLTTCCTVERKKVIPKRKGGGALRKSPVDFQNDENRNTKPIKSGRKKKDNLLEQASKKDKIAAKYRNEIFAHSIIANLEIKKILTKTSKATEKDLKLFLKAECSVRNAIKSDPELDGFYVRTCGKLINKTVLNTMADMMDNHMATTRLLWNMPRHEFPVDFHEKFVDFALNVSYTPPKKRIFVEKKLFEKSISTFTDIPGETHRTISLGNTFVYKYTERNVVDVEKYPELHALTEEAERPNNVIRCECCSSGSIKKCWNNPDCFCFQMNLKLRKEQDPKNNKLLTDFSTFDPVFIRERNHFFDTIGFACSENCACGGKCTNNITLLPEKNINKFEIYRKNEIMGFAIRTLNSIPAGTPVMEFTGELMDFDILDNIDQDYAFEIVNEAHNLHETLPNFNKRWSENFKSSLKKQLARPWFVNPKRIGNVARICCHSCQPNMAMVRVFQKGFSPAHCKLLLVTLEDIFPGVELTFDYGPGYLNELKGGCLCERIGCPNTESFGILSRATKKELKQYYALRHHFEYKRYKRIINSTAPASDE